MANYTVYGSMRHSRDSFCEKPTFYRLI